MKNALLQALNQSLHSKVYDLIKEILESEALAPIGSVALHSSPIFEYSETGGLSILKIPYPVALIYTEQEFKIGIRLALAIMGPNSPEEFPDGEEWYQEIIERLMTERDGGHVPTFVSKQDWACETWQTLLDSNESYPVEAFLQAASSKFNQSDSFLMLVKVQFKKAS